jgi:CHAT domain-containing protein
MVEYYQRLLKGEGRSAALREAQRSMITSNTRAHPQLVPRPFIN